MADVHLHLLVILTVLITVRARAQLPGTWELLLENAGIASMHTAVTHDGTVVLLDRTDIGPSQSQLSSGHCRVDPTDRLLPRGDCTAHSALFDPSTNTLRPLSIITDTWCSSGQFLHDGTLIQTGGDMDGFRRIRSFSPCNNHRCDWVELKSPLLSAGRWYATNQILPDGTMIIVGGRAAPSVEFYPAVGRQLHPFPFLAEAGDRQMDNLYPFVHLLPDGHLFVFANARAVLYNPSTGQVLFEYPILEGGPRNYPSAGSSAMLALDPADGYTKAEILVCGGAQYGAFLHRDTDALAGTTCGRIIATDPDPAWAMEEMPFPRIMGDMVMLPTGDLLVINGAQAGAQGFEMASNPCLNPVLYRPNEPAGLRFMTLNPAAVPRMYHSTANLLPDGRVLVAGSNPHYFYKFKAEFPTELRLEAFSPEYLSSDRANIRPAIEAAPEKVGYGMDFEVEVVVSLPVVGVVELNLASAPFATHSFSQGQRLVRLAVSPPVEVAGNDGVHRYRIGCKAPPRGEVAPPGYYMAFAVNLGVPSVARWVQLASI
ncbi:LOW QUALITY PROTEIN: aldehyde oxidase GLOX [Dioscorea cayenensis subsp. rotundata]|uniref:Aldehyde oxidase GLOX n=1 Tax=Dioscorea cayennensis subsp. rotundata TaxID=55577 RepID=A0AB40D0U7_DIOCR|nr:LOW QUALITY PROTEIN: aldehyde oxidase GLOX [Dioscorea cayenensis subsp. rotundata]